MALLPDLASAGLAASVVFLVTLGVLAVFVETLPRIRLVTVVVGSLVVALVLVVLGEPGISFLPLAFGAAFLANDVFERLTRR